MSVHVTEAQREALAVSTLWITSFGRLRDRAGERAGQGSVRYRIGPRQPQIAAEPRDSPI